MAKKNNAEDTQLDLFPVEPRIRGLAVTEFKLADGFVKANLTGMTLVTDVAQLDQETWPCAVAEWLVCLCANNGELIDKYIDEARQKLYELERERELTRQAMANIKNFPSGEMTLA